MELQNTLRDLFIGRRQPNVRLGAIENIDPAVLPDVPPPAPEPVVEEKEEEEEACSVCLSPMETKHTLQCGHAICGDCPAMMLTQNIGNGCVGLHPDTDIKVIKCPICRREDLPTREQLIAEIVRIRRGGDFRRMPRPAPVRHQPINPAPAPARLNPQWAGWVQQIENGHNLPAVIPVLQPQPAPINAPAPAPAPVANNPVALQDGNWLRNMHFRPRRNEDLWRNHLPQHYPIVANITADISRWNILRGHPVQDATLVGQFLNGGQRVGDGFICGVAGTRRFYHMQYFIPDETEGNVPARRLCNNAQCHGNHRSRTARRCPRGCGQFICQACNGCNVPECQPIN